MVSFLLGETEFYCSHNFNNVYLHTLPAVARAEFAARAADDANAVQNEDEVPGDMPAEFFSHESQ